MVLFKRGRFGVNTHMRGERFGKQEGLPTILEVTDRYGVTLEWKLPREMYQCFNDGTIVRLEYILGKKILALILEISSGTLITLPHSSEHFRALLQRMEWLAREINTAINGNGQASENILGEFHIRDPRVIRRALRKRSWGEQLHVRYARYALIRSALETAVMQSGFTTMPHMKMTMKDFFEKMEDMWRLVISSLEAFEEQGVPIDAKAKEIHMGYAARV